MCVLENNLCSILFKNKYTLSKLIKSQKNLISHQLAHNLKYTAKKLITFDGKKTNLWGLYERNETEIKNLKCIFFCFVFL